MDDSLDRFSQVAEMVSRGGPSSNWLCTSRSAGDGHVTASNSLHRVSKKPEYLFL